MKAILISGEEHLYVPGCHFDKEVHLDAYIVNLLWWPYFRYYTFKDNILTVYTEDDGKVLITFSEIIKTIKLIQIGLDQLKFEIEK